ncbi:MAG: fibronectin type III domain-containing protein [Bacteroidia bacterium]|nr:fibronectin type III domain-containing protein [Bacteroidia bacterium]
MKSGYLRLFICIIFSLPIGESRSGAFAQTYPVQLSTQLVPPYSGYLPDYAAPGGEKLHAIILLKDLTKPIYAVRLTVKIDGQGFTMQTKASFKSPPVNIEPGTPVEVSADVLAQLLDSKNLDFTGINKNDYEQRKVLPEGYYKVCFTAYDYYNPVSIQVSNESCANAWMTLSDPPQLNLPLCGSTVNTSTPQFIVFGWMPMNQGSPNSAQNTEYIFELWEIRPDGAAANNIVQTLPPVYTATTDLTMLNYGITETPLNPGMEYAWRVRAKDKNGYDNFKNKGYSAVCTFRYGNKYEGLGDALKLKLKAIPLTPRMATLSWDSIAAYNQYTLNYRKLGWNDWFETNTANSRAKAYDLEPQTNYEARVQGTTAEGFVGEWSNTVVFKTPSFTQYSCGDAPYGTSSTNKKPLLSAFPGMFLQVGQFEMLVTEIQGSNGRYSGFGRIDIPFMITKLNVSFTTIFVNEDRVVTSGQVKALTDGVDKWVLNKIIEEAEDKANYTDGTIDSVIVKGGKVCTYANGGKEPVNCVDAPKPGEVLVIRDGEGNQYTIEPDGTVTKSGFLKTSTDELDATSSEKIIFKASPDRKYGFDEKQYAAWAGNYEAIKLKDNVNYFVPYAGIAEGKSDEVRALVTIRNFDPGKLIFKTSGGQELSGSSSGSGQYLVPVPADGQSVYAYYDNKKVGKLNVVNLKPLTRKVVIVPVNGAAVSSNIESDLNSIYKQANVSWSVTIAKNFDFSYDVNSNGLDVAETDLMNKYSPEMRAIRDAYRKDSTYDKNAYYLFAVSKFSDNATQGYMVRGRAVGFVASTSSATTIAHELGHGVFGLEHTFPAIEMGKTNNLLDYGNGTDLSNIQWKIIHSPLPALNWFDEEEDAAFIDIRKQLVEFLAETKNAGRENKNVNLNGNYKSYLSADDLYINAINYKNIYIKFLPQYGTVLSPKNNITESTYMLNGVNTKCLDIEGRVKIFAWPESRLENLKIYLTNIMPVKNLLLFVNGYRIDERAIVPVVELPDTKNEIYQADVLNYWSGMDAAFMNQIGTKNVVYADGHHSISTSNHHLGSGITSQAKFMASMKSSMKAAGTITNTAIDWATGDVVDAVYCYHRNSCVILDTVPNTGGFITRMTNGMKAGNELVRKINAGEVVFNKLTDTLDIVCHSMGFAYAQGMIEMFKLAKIKLGRYYIIAPENACSGTVSLSDFDEVWQYGSNLGMPGQDNMWEQDGVAPQCVVGGIEADPNKGGRVGIPPNAGFTKTFDESHYVKNYGWIFKRALNQAGYVKRRH